MKCAACGGTGLKNLPGRDGDMWYPHPCPACGPASPAAAPTRFCVVCGGPVDAPAVQPSSGVWSHTDPGSCVSVLRAQRETLQGEVAAWQKRATQAESACAPAAAPPETPGRATDEPECHDLKTWPDPFAALWRGDKAFEVRRDDRGYEVGDCLHLREWGPPGCGAYTGRWINAIVTYIARDAWGLPPGLVVLGIRETTRSASPVERETTRNTDDEGEDR